MLFRSPTRMSRIRFQPSGVITLRLRGCAFPPAGNVVRAGFCPSCANVSRAPPRGVASNSLRAEGESPLPPDRSRCGARGASRLAPRPSAPARLSPEISVRVTASHPREGDRGREGAAGRASGDGRQRSGSANRMNHRLNQSRWCPLKFCVAPWSSCRRREPVAPGPHLLS